jgi:hypothetical protein
MSLLTVEELREHVASGLPDDALERLLDAAEAAINAEIGPAGQRVEHVDGGGTVLILRHPAASVALVRENGRDVDADDYHIEGYLIRRDRGRWGSRVAVTYTPADDDATRKAVQIALVQLDLNYEPGMEQQTAGNWNEMFVGDYEAERRKVLARLAPSTGLVVR